MKRWLSECVPKATETVNPSTLHDRQAGPLPPQKRSAMAMNRGNTLANTSLGSESCAGDGLVLGFGSPVTLGLLGRQHAVRTSWLR